MQEYYVDYEYALCLYNYGDMSSAVDYLKSYNANNQSIEANDLLQKIDQPLVYIVDNANQKLDKWLNRGTELGAFILTPPALLKNKSTIVSLVKAEFETKKSFNQRVALAQQEAVDKDDMAEKKYQRQLATYNQALNDYSVKIKQEVQKKEQDSLDTYLDFVIQNIANVLGTPYLVNAIYDADKQQMFAELLSNKSNFHRSVVVDVPLEDAKDFKINTAKVLPTLEFDTTRKSLSVVGVSMELGGKLYQAKFLNNNNYATSLRNSVDAVDIISKY
ncbi:hypothetical protein MNB_SUP05-SYMBIONT-4-401 [hydrothermal vent metagenome]|uniref:Uncharacterized protein n=1 Tax=hydrothermal vent metagenome TaxID=652676 RepID=A0A1W1DZM9_9ZZZZ